MMLGWMILFALMVILNAILIFIGQPLEAAPRIATSVFAVLFVVGLLTRAARSRVW